MQKKSHTQKNKKKNHKKAIQTSNTKYRKKKTLNNKVKQNNKQENVDGPCIHIPFEIVRYLYLSAAKKTLVVKSSFLLFISMVLFKISFGVPKKLLITGFF